MKVEHSVVSENPKIIRHAYIDYTFERRWWPMTFLALIDIPPVPWEYPLVIHIKRVHTPRSEFTQLSNRVNKAKTKQRMREQSLQRFILIVRHLEKLVTYVSLAK